MNATLFRRVGAAALVAAAAAALAGCGGGGGTGAKLTFNDVEKAKVSQIVLDGSSGEVVVRTSPIDETRITRTVHTGSDPGVSYTLVGSQLRLGTSCGHDCRVSYDIETPPGVAVTGALTSGYVALNGVGSADVRVSSGDVEIRGATGPVRARSTSGDVTVSDSTGPATLQATSGDIRAVRMSGGVTAAATSGDINVKLDSPTSVTATASSGDVEVVVPAGSYQVRTHPGSGNVRLDGVTNDTTAKNVLDLGSSSGDVKVAVAPAA
jgi:hypothetical protein